MLDYPRRVLDYPRRVLALALLVFFVRMAWAPGAFTSGTFSAAFEVAGPRAWGLGMSVLFAVVFAVRWRPANVVAAGALLGWSAGLALADLRGDSEAPLGWAFTLAVALLFVWGQKQPHAPPA